MNKTYKDRGYTETFERTQEDRKIPYMSQFDIDSYIEGISGRLIHGGMIKSKDGKLVIDLENGTIYYDDGVEVTTIV